MKSNVLQRINDLQTLPTFLTYFDKQRYAGLSKILNKNGSHHFKK